MDPKKTSSKSPEERAEALSSGRDREAERASRRSEGPDGASSGADESKDSQRSTKSDGPEDALRSTKSGRSDRTPQLTEKQRIEARQLRQEQRRRGRRAPARSAGSKERDGSPSPGGNALSRGVRATGTEIKRTAIFLVGLLPAGLDRLGPVGRVLRTGLGQLLRRIGRAAGAAASAVATVWARLGKAVLATDRSVTPRAATVAIAGAGVVALVVSQFLDFRATEIGQTGYSAVLDITRAPRQDLVNPLGAHSVLLLAVAALALVGVAGSALTGRRPFGLLVAGSGLATVAVGLLIDLPRGLDVGEAAISYTGVAAVLLTGFWLQLAAGAVLMAAGLGLAAARGRGGPEPTDPRSPARSRRDPGERRRSSGRPNPTTGNPTTGDPTTGTPA